MFKFEKNFFIILISIFVILLTLAFLALFLPQSPINLNPEANTQTQSNSEISSSFSNQSNSNSEDTLVLNFQTLEIADSEQELAQGLMQRDLCDECGMLFVYQESKPIAFWMKDTPTSLDMLFINENGEIVSIYENTVPNNEIILYESIQPVKYGLEVKAGFVAKNNLEVGQFLDIPKLLESGVEYQSEIFLSN